MTVRGVSPLARAVRTKSDASTANIEARVMRAIGANEKMPMLRAGRISCLRLATNTSQSCATVASIR